MRSQRETERSALSSCNAANTGSASDTLRHPGTGKAPANSHPGVHGAFAAALRFPRRRGVTAGAAQISPSLDPIGENLPITIVRPGAAGRLRRLPCRAKRNLPIEPWHAETLNIHILCFSSKASTKNLLFRLRQKAWLDADMCRLGDLGITLFYPLRRPQATTPAMDTLGSNFG